MLLKLNYNDYPFGSPMPGRKYQSSTAYRYGFNGKEKDDELKGSGNSYDFGARIYDSRLGRWLSLDPLQVKYPGLSPYNSFENSPIYFADPDGMDAIAKVEGKTITITAVIYITGDGATKAKAKAMQTQIMKEYKGGTANGYNIKFDIQVQTIDNPSALPKDGKSNLITLVDKSKLEDGRSFVKGTGGNTGTWDKAPAKGAKTYAHETGHLIGLADQYSDWIKDKKAEIDPLFKPANRPEKQTVYYDGVQPNSDLMANHNSVDAKITSNEFKSIVDFVLKTKDKTGTSMINFKSIYSSGGKGLGVTDTQKQMNRNNADSKGYIISKEK